MLCLMLVAFSIKHKKKEKDTPLYSPPFLSPYNPYSIPPYNPPIKRKKNFLRPQSRFLTAYTMPHLGLSPTGYAYATSIPKHQASKKKNKAGAKKISSSPKI